MQSNPRSWGLSALRKRKLAGKALSLLRYGGCAFHVIVFSMHLISARGPSGSVHGAGCPDEPCLSAVLRHRDQAGRGAFHRWRAGSSSGEIRMLQAGVTGKNIHRDLRIGPTPHTLAQLRRAAVRSFTAPQSGGAAESSSRVLRMYYTLGCNTLHSQYGVYRCDPPRP